VDDASLSYSRLPLGSYASNENLIIKSIPLISPVRFADSL